VKEIASERNDRSSPTLSGDDQWGVSRNGGVLKVRGSDGRGRRRGEKGGIEKGGRIG